MFVEMMSSSGGGGTPNFSIDEQNILDYPSGWSLQTNNAMIQIGAMSGNDYAVFFSCAITDGVYVEILNLSSPRNYDVTYTNGIVTIKNSTTYPEPRTRGYIKAMWL